MRQKRFSPAVFAFSLFALISLFSCSQIEDAIEDALGLSPPSLNVNIAAPTEDPENYGFQASDIATCRVDFYKNSGKFYSCYGSCNSSVSQNVQEGDYAVYVYGYDSVGTYLALGSAYASVEHGEKDVNIQLSWDLANKMDYVVVRFNTNGGTAIDSQKIQKGSTATQPSDPTKIGCTFEGWYTTSDFSSEFNFSTAIEYNRTIFARWAGRTVGDLYVSQTGSDTTGDGTESAPFATLQKAIDTLRTLGSLSADYTIYVSGRVVGNTEIPSTLKVNSLLITGKSGASSDILDGNAQSNVIEIFSASTITFKNITITNGLATTRNGAGISIKTGANVVLDTGTVISGNRATWKEENNRPTSGGGVFVSKGSSLTMKDGAVIKNNTVYGNGGGINCEKEGADFTMLGGEISGNSSGYTDSSGNIYGGHGGGIRIGSDCVFVYSGGSIKNNTAGSGGGVFNKGTLFMYGSAVIGDASATTAATASSYSNYASGGGAGLFNDSGAVAYLGYSSAGTEATLSGGICYNYKGDGAGILNNNGTVKMASGSVSYNGHEGYAVGVLNNGSDATFELSGGKISHNVYSGIGTGYGGGIRNQGGTLTITGGEISYNESGNGGGVMTISGTVTMSGGKICNNTATQGGGGVYVKTGTFTMSGGTISENTASENGGGMYIYGYTNTYGTTMSGGTIKGNTAQGNGNGVYLSDIGKFSMSASALVSSDNDVYLSSGNYITVGGSLSATSPVATITPSAYTDGATVLSGTTALLASEYTKFALTPKTGESWSITSDGKMTNYEVSSGTVSDIGFETPSGAGDLTYYLTLDNVTRPFQQYSSALTFKNNNAGTTLTVYLTLIGNNTLTADNHGGLKLTGVSGARINVIFCTTSTGTLTCKGSIRDIQVENVTGTFSKQDGLYFTSATINGTSYSDMDSFFTAAQSSNSGSTFTISTEP